MLARWALTHPSGTLAWKSEVADRDRGGQRTLSSIPLSEVPFLYRLLTVEVGDVVSDGAPLNEPQFETGDSHARGEATQTAGAADGPR